eukprot:gene13688-15114_t
MDFVFFVAFVVGLLQVFPQEVLSSSSPAHAWSLDGEICRTKMCRFELVVQEELSMTTKYTPGKILSGGETLLLELKNGKLVKKLGTFYQQATFADEEGQVVNVSRDVITADGFRRSLITINGQFPGPTLQVMSNAEVEVTVKNQMLHSSITMHWHGFHLHNTPWMDGVGYITQCPIVPGSTFVYRFKAYPSGILWYHGHFGGLRADGAFGLFIVHEEAPEIPFFPFLVNHWLHIPFSEYMTTNPYRKTNKYMFAGPGMYTYSFEHMNMTNPRTWRAIDGIRLSSMMYTSALINGRGRFENNKAPISWFTVREGSRFGFYIINPGIEYTFAISIDQHEFLLTALDITDVKPRAVRALYLNPGERVKVEVLANQPKDNYWIRSKTLDDQGEVLAVLHYDGAGYEEPLSSPAKCSKKQQCVIYNCRSSNLPTPSISCLAAMDMESVGRAVEFAKKVQNVDKELFFSFAFPIVTAVNGYRFTMPQNHLYSDLPLEEKCTPRKCKDKVCRCTHIVDLPFNKTIQLVFTNIGRQKAAWTPSHNSPSWSRLCCLKTGFPEADPITGDLLRNNRDLVCEDQLCRKTRWINYEQVAKTFNLKNPPSQDSVLLPFGGYVVVRIRTDNPGICLCTVINCSMALKAWKLLFELRPR